MKFLKTVFEFIKRPRHGYIFVLGGWLIHLMYASDPDGGAVTNQGLQKLLGGALIVACVHWSRKAIFDYIDIKQYFQKAKEAPTGAGLAVVGVGLALIALAIIFSASAYAQNVRTFIPEGAYTYAPQLVTEQKTYWSNHPDPKFSGVWSSKSLA